MVEKCEHGLTVKEIGNICCFRCTNFNYQYKCTIFDSFRITEEKNINYKPTYCYQCLYSSFDLEIKDAHTKFMIEKMCYEGKCKRLDIWIKKNSNGCDKGLNKELLNNG